MRRFILFAFLCVFAAFIAPALAITGVSRAQWIKTNKVVTSFGSAIISNSTTITMPSSLTTAMAGYLIDIAVNSTSTIPTTVTPSGWTLDQSYNAVVAGFGVRANISRKALVSGDSGATITGMVGTLFLTAKSVIVLQGSGGTTFSAITSQNGVAGSSFPAQTITPTSLSGAAIGYALDATPTTTGLVMSPSPANTINDTVSLEVGWSPFSGSPLVFTVNTNGFAFGALGSFWAPYQ